MYKCQECGTVSLPKEQVNKLVTEMRKKEYEFEVQKGRNTITKNSQGWEIVKEIEVCKECYNKLNKELLMKLAELGILKSMHSFLGEPLKPGRLRGKFVEVEYIVGNELQKIYNQDPDIFIDNKKK